MKTLALLLAVTWVLVASKSTKRSLDGQIVQLDRLDSLKRDLVDDYGPPPSLDHYMKFHLRSEDGQLIDFNLVNNRKLLRDIPIETDDGNSTMKTTIREIGQGQESGPYGRAGKHFHERNMFYHDRAHHRRAVVALTDHGDKIHMRATFNHEGEFYHVEPVNDHPTNGHRIMKSAFSSHYDMKGVEMTVRSEEVFEATPVGNDTANRKRAASDFEHPEAYNVEILLVTDFTFYDQCKKLAGSSSRSRVTECIYFRLNFIMNGMDLSYSEVNKYPIDTWAKGIYIATNEAASVWTKAANRVNGDRNEKRVYEDSVLEDVGKWAFETKGYSWDQYDHIMMFTKFDMGYVERGQWQSGTIGLAYTKRVCYPARQCSIVEDTGMDTWLTSTHELGHNLGAGHDDGRGDCAKEQLHVMTSQAIPPDARQAANLDTFSTCSEDQIVDNLYGNEQLGPKTCTYNAVCANEDPNVNWADSPDDLPGQKWSKDKQCEAALGSGWTFYTGPEIGDTNICRSMWCRNGNSLRRAGTAADGTYCGSNGNERSQWCIRGQCVRPGGNPVQGGTSRTVRNQYFRCGATLNPPRSCTDRGPIHFNTGEVKTCQDIVENDPFYCGTQEGIRQACCASCFRKGYVR